MSPKKTRSYRRKKNIAPNQIGKKFTNKSKKIKRKTKWFAGKDNNFMNSISSFTGVEKINIDVEDASPYALFKQIFTEEIFEHIVFETNRYAAQCNKPTFNITINDLKLFFAMNIAMTYLKYPNVRMYWSSVEGIRLNLIADIMPVNRFTDIKRYLHFEDNSIEPNIISDKFWKLRPIINMLHKSFHEAANAEEHIAIDEMMVPFKGRSHLKQYLKAKSKKWGFKIWVQANTNGYVNCFDIYQGSSNEACSLFGPIGDTVLKLCHQIHGYNHTFFIDNLFTSLPVIRELKKYQIHTVGTLRINRANDVQSMLVDPKLLQRGCTSMATSDDNITILRWKDTKVVHTISTYAGAEPKYYFILYGM